MLFAFYHIVINMHLSLFYVFYGSEATVHYMDVVYYYFSIVETNNLRETTKVVFIQFMI